LARRTVVIHHDGSTGTGQDANKRAERQSSLFSKARYGGGDNGGAQDDLDVDDPDFWMKWAKARGGPMCPGAFACH
jgi:hypothetical protein